MKRFVMVIALVLGMAGTASAEGFYLSGKIGAFEPNHDADGLQYFSTGFSGELTFGWRARPYLALETGVGYVNASDGGDTLSAIPILLTAKGIFPLLSDKVELFLGGGVGFYFASADAGGSSESGNGFGYHLVAGADYRFTDVFSLGIELKRNFVEVELFGTEGEIGGTTYALVGRFQL